MQSKGAIRLTIIALAIASLWQLSFTAVTALQEKKADKYAAKAVEAFKQTADYSNIKADDQAFVLDSIAKSRKSWYVDSLSNENVYLGYSFKEKPKKSTSALTSRAV